MSVLDAQHGALVFSRAKKEAAKITNQAKQACYRRHIKHIFNTANSLFSPFAVESMRNDCGLILPDKIDGFRQAAKIARFRAPKATEFQAPDLHLQRRTFRAWLRLGRCAPDDIPTRNMFLAAGLAISCGLRIGEIAQLRWRHLTADADGRPRLIAPRGEVRVKKGSGELSVRPLDPFWRLMLRAVDRNNWQGKPGDYVLAQRQPAGKLSFRIDGHCDRTFFPFRHVSKWLRDLGWSLQKTNHSLRDCACSYVTMKWGLERAKIFARHESVKTTESHYGRFVREDILDNPNRLPWLQWAK